MFNPPTALSLGVRTLYHWEPLTEKYLVPFLQTGRLHMSSPANFNDPWDCKPFFNTAALDDPEVHRKHVDWAVTIATRVFAWPAQNVENMRATLMSDKQRAAELLVQMSDGLWPDIAKRYRVYCLGPDPTNVLMWSHYANDHKGICLEYDLRNNAMCGTLKCEYLAEFPMLSPEGGDLSEALTVLLAKSEIWSYEKEFRLVVQERAHALGKADIVTDDDFLQLPKGALTAIIVGCQGDAAAVQRLVDEHAPGLTIKRAVRVPNRYAIVIDG